jgi:error-prone DNA polymerase
VRPVEYYREAFGDRLYLGVQAHCSDDDEKRLAALRRLGRRMRIPLIAVNDVHYHEPGRRFLQDVLVCVREGCRLAEAGSRLFANGERYLKSYDELMRVFHAYPDAIERTR